MSSETQVVNVKFGGALLGQIDGLVQTGYYSNRSEFLREAARKSLVDVKRSLMAARLPKEFDSVEYVRGRKKKTRDMAKAIREANELV